MGNVCRVKWWCMQNSPGIQNPDRHTFSKVQTINQRCVFNTCWEVWQTRASQTPLKHKRAPYPCNADGTYQFRGSSGGSEFRIAKAWFSTSTTFWILTKTPSRHDDYRRHCLVIQICVVFFDLEIKHHTDINCFYTCRNLLPCAQE